LHDIRAVHPHNTTGDGVNLDPTPAYSEFLSGRVGPAYNEAAFRYFLSVDRSRARRTQRAVHLVLVALSTGNGRRATLTNGTATVIFEGLGASVREVDFVGWYQEGYVAAAVLAQGVKAPTDRMAPLIAARVRAELSKRLPLEQAGKLRVRAVRLGGSTYRRPS
jgi:hypothetical protein